LRRRKKGKGRRKEKTKGQRREQGTRELGCRLKKEEEGRLKTGD
jgi:hypothetical protein